MPSASSDFLLLEGDPPSKREILRCALHLFVQDGLCETSIRDIAEASGYTNPALYKFFESKEALALHLFERCYLRLASVIHGSQKREDFATDLDSLVRAYARLVDESLEAVLFVNDTLRLFWPKLPKASRRHSLISELRELVARGVETGVVSRAVDKEIAVALLVGTMGQIARMAYFDELGGSLTERVLGMRKLFYKALLEKPQ
jgi:AcrR family transcriptional regulator